MADLSVADRSNVAGQPDCAPAGGGARPPVDRLVTVAPSEEASVVLRTLAGCDVDQVPVVEDGRLVGLLRRRERPALGAIAGRAPHPLNGPYSSPCVRSSSVASRAPSASAWSLAQATLGATVVRPTNVPKPQSVPAMTFCAPTRCA
jgi:hypothetical protein